MRDELMAWIGTRWAAITLRSKVTSVRIKSCPWWGIGAVVRIERSRWASMLGVFWALMASRDAADAIKSCSASHATRHASMVVMIANAGTPPKEDR